MKTVTITEFRKNIFRLVDEVLATGESIVIDRKGGSVVVRGQQATDIERRRERFKQFMASPPLPGWENVDLSPQDIRRERESYWTWDEEPELDR